MSDLNITAARGLMIQVGVGPAGEHVSLYLLDASTAEGGAIRTQNVALRLAYADATRMLKELARGVQECESIAADRTRIGQERCRTVGTRRA